MPDERILVTRSSMPTLEEYVNERKAPRVEYEDKRLDSSDSP